jgi:L-threonylcarbamoyladenylate synthase
MAPSILGAAGVRDTAPVDRLVTTDLARAAAVLKAGGLVGLPTETVYGLAADAENHTAVARIFSVKGRPADHPLIVHVPGAGHLDAWAARVPAYAHRLAEALWPGPLTLVLPRATHVGDHVTGGQETVGLRAPAHPVARELLAITGLALAAPSANRFGRVSPTTAAHVVTELGGLLDPARDIVLDGGPCGVGVESAILDCTGPAPVILRPGAIDAATVARIGGVTIVERASRVRAPGTLTSHYAPSARVVLAADAEAAQAALARRERHPADGPLDHRLDGLLGTADVETPPGVVRLSAPRDAAEYAQVLYAALREADALGVERVVAVPPAGGGIAAAVGDRLARAAAASSHAARPLPPPPAPAPPPNS